MNPESGSVVIHTNEWIWEMALFLNVERDMVPGRNRDFRIGVRNFSRISECYERLSRAENQDRVRCENGDIIITGMFGSRNIVPDVYRYDIQRGQNEFTLSPHSVCEVNLRRHNNYMDRPAINAGTPSLVVVVESPHKEEYHNADLSCPIAAAQGDTSGSTGYEIHHHLEEIVNLVANDVMDMGDVYEVIIANPIRWQTSLVTLHGQSPRNSPWKELRDAVWSALWGIAAVRCDFLTRLCSYNPSIVVNACTGGAGNSGLNAKVDRFLLCNNIVSDENHRPRTPHPSVWNQQHNRRIYQIVA